MMRVIQIAGFLGSGKTTAMVKIARSLSAKHGKKVAIIVNEIGSVPVDVKVLEGQGLKVSELGGGCVCCELLVSLAETLAGLSRTVKPDIVLIEPTGVSVPDQVKEGIKLGGSMAALEAGPVVVLMDSLLETALIEGDPAENFLLRQISGADIVAINKIDAAAEADLLRFEARAREINPKAQILRISALRGDGIEALIDSLASSDS